MIQKGFILMDVLIGVLILSLTLVVISILYIQAMDMDRMSYEETIVAHLAQTQLELLKTRTPEYWSSMSLPCFIAWQDDTEPFPSQYTLTTQADITAASDHLVQVTVNGSFGDSPKKNNIHFITFYHK